ncbi:NAD(P)H-binding protein [Streptosporangiaceae bacterium NEAU-GS5]|nr:NAD(P)H-binding protein [Streptosporangiaceae bacterium NEAU-GS5]
MRLAVFGATGRVGRELVSQGLELGHEVVAFVRDPAKLAARERLTLVTGDARDPASAARAVEGADAVLSALGTRRLWNVTICTDGIRAVLAAMAEHGVGRLVALSMYGVGDSGLHATTMRLLVPAILRDKERMEGLIRASATQWTVIRPAVIIGDTRTGRYRIGSDLHLTPASTVSTADVAAAMLAAAADPASVGQALAITH